MENKIKIQVPVMADLAAQGKQPEWLFWVGSAGAFDDRYKKVTREFAKILTFLGVDYAVLGSKNWIAAMCPAEPETRCCFRCKPCQIFNSLKCMELKR